MEDTERAAAIKKELDFQEKLMYTVLHPESSSYNIWSRRAALWASKRVLAALRSKK